MNTINQCYDFLKKNCIFLCVIDIYMSKLIHILNQYNLLLKLQKVIHEQWKKTFFGVYIYYFKVSYMHHICVYIIYCIYYTIYVYYTYMYYVYYAYTYMMCVCVCLFMRILMSLIYTEESETNTIKLASIKKKTTFDF